MMQQPMKKFEESDRLNYALTPDSVVVEVGAYQGFFTGKLWEKFGCQIHTFEPVKEFREPCVARFIGNPKITVYPFGLAGKPSVTTMAVKGELTGLFCSDPNTHEEVALKDVVTVLDELGIGDVELIVINCEGGEYELLERMLESGIVTRFKNISVQMHTVAPNYEWRWGAIFDRLKKTHDHVYGEPFVWDGFTLRT